MNKKLFLCRKTVSKVEHYLATIKRTQNVKFKIIKATS